MVINIDTKRSNRSSGGHEDVFNIPTYVQNNPINKMDPSGHDPDDNDQQAIPPNLTAPEGVPSLFVYRYTEGEWAKKRIQVGEKRDFGQWTYMAVAKTDDPENFLQASVSNAGRGIRDFMWGWAERPFGVPFMGPRDRVDYVDVTFKLSYQHYLGPLDAGDKDRADLAFLKHYADNQVTQLSKQLNKDLKYYYIEQFGGAVAAELVGGVLRLRTAVVDAQAEVGGPAALNLVAGNARVEKYVKDLGERVILEDRQCIIQTRETNCVPASLEQALGPDSQPKLLSMNAEASKGGYDIKDAISYLRGRNLAPNATLEQSITVDELEQMAKAKKPVVLNVRGTDATGRVGHAIVIEGWQDDKFIISDPLAGPYLQSKDALKPRLTGYGQAITNLK